MIQQLQTLRAPADVRPPGNPSEDPPATQVERELIDLLYELMVCVQMHTDQLDALQRRIERLEAGSDGAA